MGDKTILVVEDDKGIINILSTIFKVHNISAVFAETGTDALALYNSNKIDTVVCDYMLPDFNGNVVLEEIRKCAGKVNTPFIFLSAFADPDDIKRGLDAGANEYITKPFSAKHLISTINKYLNSRVD